MDRKGRVKVFLSGTNVQSFLPSLMSFRLMPFDERDCFGWKNKFNFSPIAPAMSDFDVYDIFSKYCI